MMLDDRTAMISADDLGWGGDLSMKVVQAAARMAHQRGFERFQIISSADSSATGVVPIAGHSTTTTTGSAYCYSAWCHGMATTSSYGTPAYLLPYTENKKRVVVHFLHPGEAPVDGSAVYETAAILSNR
jgi:hypothetical protein